MNDYSQLTDEEIRLLHKQTISNIAKYKTMQLAMKIALNSAYGAVG